MSETNEDHRASGQPSGAGSRRVRENPAVADAEAALRILANPRATPETIRRLSEDARYQSVYAVRAATALHPAAPLNVALRAAQALYRRDLARIAENARLAPPVRARAEQILCERVGEMTTGEQVSLARVATRRVIETLKNSTERRVVEALLGNPRIVEEDVLAIATREEAPGAVLSAVARSGRWGKSYAVKLALSQNPSCPAIDSLRSLRGLLARDLRRISENAVAPRLVRMAALRALDGADAPGR